jgi:transcriptional regulator with XRE-family HTH domain
MSREEFLSRLEKLKISQKQFSEIAGCSYQTVKQWKDDKIPKWVFLLLDHITILQSAKKYTLK